MRQNISRVASVRLRLRFVRRTVRAGPVFRFGWFGQGKVVSVLPHCLTEGHGAGFGS